MLNDNKKHKDNQELAYEIIKVLDGVAQKDALAACAIVSAFLIDTASPPKYRQYTTDNFFTLTNVIHCFTDFTDFTENN